MPFSNYILISPQGLTEDEHIILNTAVKLLAHQGKPFKVDCENVMRAHLLILNVNNEVGRKYFEESRRGQVKLLITKTQQTGNNIISINASLEVSLLVDILGKLFGKMHQQLESARAKLPRMGGVTNDSSNLLTDTVFHLLLSTKENKGHIRIGTNGYPDLFIDGENQSVMTTASTEDIGYIIHQPLNEHIIEKLNAATSEIAEGNISSLYHILWVSAVSCSNGVLLPGHNANVPVRLKAWPNFTRNDFKPAYLKLAAVLAQRPVALSDLEELTQVPYSDIVNFYNAAFAVDLIEKNVQSTTVKPIERKVTKEKKGLFSKIADRLGFGQQKLKTANA